MASTHSNFTLIQQIDNEYNFIYKKGKRQLNSLTQFVWEYLKNVNCATVPSQFFNFYASRLILSLECATRARWDKIVTIVVKVHRAIHRLESIINPSISLRERFSFAQNESCELVQALESGNRSQLIEFSDLTKIKESQVPLLFHWAVENWELRILIPILGVCQLDQADTDFLIEKAFEVHDLRRFEKIASLVMLHHFDHLSARSQAQIANWLDHVAGKEFKLILPHLLNIEKKLLQVLHINEPKTTHIQSINSKSDLQPLLDRISKLLSVEENESMEISSSCWNTFITQLYSGITVVVLKDSLETILSVLSNTESSSMDQEQTIQKMLQNGARPGDFNLFLILETIKELPPQLQNQLLQWAKSKKDGAVLRFFIRHDLIDSQNFEALVSELLQSGSFEMIHDLITQERQFFLSMNLVGRIQVWRMNFQNSSKVPRLSLPPIREEEKKEKVHENAPFESFLNAISSNDLSEIQSLIRRSTAEQLSSIEIFELLQRALSHPNVLKKLLLSSHFKIEDHKFGELLFQALASSEFEAFTLLINASFSYEIQLEQLIVLNEQALKIGFETVALQRRIQACFDEPS